MCGGGGGGLAGIGKAISGAVSGITKSISGALSGIGKAVSTIAKNPVFQALAPIALNFFLPGAGLALTGALGISASFAPALMGAVTGGALGALGGGSLKSAAIGAALGGVSAGVGDYLATNNNPLSGMFSGAEGGAAANPLTAGGVGSTQLTGIGSGVGIDSSTLGTQLAAAPSASSGGFGLNPSAPTGNFGQLTPPGASNVGSLLNQGQPGFLDSLKAGNFMDAGKALIPSSTLGKVALGGVALSALGGMGGAQPQQEGPPSGDPYGLDPSFHKKLEHQNFSYNQSAPTDLSNYGLSNQIYNPRTRRFESSGVENPNAGEHIFVRPQFTTPVAAAPVVRAAGGMVDSNQLYQDPMGQDQMGQMGMMGQMSPLQAYAQNYARGGMMNDGVQTGVSDDVSAFIDGDSRRPAKLSASEYVLDSKTVAAIGEGSSASGAKILDRMVARINKLSRSRGAVGKDTGARNLLPA